MSVRLGQNHGYLAGVGGIRLHYRTWEVARPRAALLVVHGLAEHGGRYGRFAERMAGHGYATFAPDLRGHGRSEGRRGHVPSFDLYLQDLDRFRREVTGLVDPGCPLVLLGHSLGGLIALRYVEEYPSGVSAAILSSPWMGTSGLPVPRWKILAAPVLSNLLPALPTRAGIQPPLLSRDTEVVERYRTDPLVHDTITPRAFTEAADAIGTVLPRSDRIAVPLLFLLGSDDRLMPPERTLAFARATGREDAVAVFPGFYHEVLNEPGSGAVEDRVREWLASVLT